MFRVVGRSRPRAVSVAVAVALALVVQVAVVVLPPQALGGLFIVPAHAQPWLGTATAVAGDPPPVVPSVALSGAEPAYPLNNTLDASPSRVAAPDNVDFEAAVASVGTPPSNHDIQTAPQIAGTAPTNNGFDSGLSGWTVDGSATAKSDTTRGGWAQLSSGTLTSAAFTVGTSAQSVAFDLGYLSATTTDFIQVDVLTGAAFDTATRVGSPNCYRCGPKWTSFAADATPFRGQTVKVRVKLVGGLVGIDLLRPEVTLPGWDTVGGVTRTVEANGNTYATLASGAKATTAAVDVPAGAQLATVGLFGPSGAGNYYNLYVLSGANFATATRVAANKAAPAGWSEARVNLGPWLGQRIRLRFEATSGDWGIDNAGQLKVETPSWTVVGDARRASDSSGTFVTADAATLISAPVALPSEAQTISVKARTTAPAGRVTVSALTGTGYATAVTIKQVLLVGDGQWHTVTVGVYGQAGKTVKLQFATSTTIDLDDAGVVDTVLPRWSVYGAAAVTAGQDAGGSYVEPAPLTDLLEVRSAPIDPGLVDTPATTQSRYYSITYDIGNAPLSAVKVVWVTSAGSWQLFGDAADSPTGRRTRLFPVHDFLGTTGQLHVTVSGGRVYEVGANAARQQLGEPYSGKAGQIVDTSTGAFGYTDTDITPTGAAALGYTRYYNGHSDVAGVLGWRWTDSYDTSLYWGVNGDVGVVFGAGVEEFFAAATAGGYSPLDPRVHSTLTKNNDGTYTYTTPANLAYQFTAAGRLSRVVDANSQATTLSYDGAGRLTTVEAAGVRLTRAYDGSGRLVSVTDPAGATTRYGYDAAGDLVSVTDPNGGVRAYSYDRHLLTRVVDPTGATVFTNTFDTAQRVTRQTDAAGKSLTFGYNTPGAGATTVTDAMGLTGYYYFDRQHRTTHAVDPAGNMTRSVYDGAGNLEKVIDPADHTVTLGHDAAGNVTSATDPLGRPTQITYNTKHLPTAVTDARGNTTRFEYDDRGNLTASTDPLGHTSRSTYDTAGNQLTATDPLGRTTTHTYDDHGNRTSTTDPTGATTHWTYDAAGRTLTATDPLGRTTHYTYGLLGHLLAVTDPADNTTTYLYDSAGRLVRVEDELERRTSWTYDSRGLVTTKTDPAGSVTTYEHDADERLTTTIDPLGRTTRYTYTSAGLISAVTDPAGHTTRYTYHPTGAVASTSDPLGRTSSYAYDNAGRLTTRTLPTGTAWHYAYDQAGNLTTQTDPAGRATTYTYDAATRLTDTTAPGNRITRFTYDAADQRTAITDPAGHTTETSYDANGRTTAITDPAGAVTRYAFDAAGQLTTVTDPMGQATTHTYDPAGRLAATTDPLGGVTRTTYDAAGQTLTQTSAAGRVSRYAYDPRGLTTQTTDPAGHVTQNAYDAVGQPTRVTDPLGNATTYTYTPAGQPESMTDALDGTVRFGYDPAGQRTTVTDQRGKTWTTTYTALGQPATTTDPLGRATAYEYDTAGQPTAVTDARGLTTRTGYDPAGRTATVTRPEGPTTYTYDQTGRRTGATTPGGISSWTYDPAGNLTSATTPTGTIDYTYDAAGRRTLMALPGNQVVRYGYDHAGRLTTLTDPAGAATTFSYDPDGLRTGTTRPNGVSTTVAYTPDQQPATIEHRTAAAVIARYTYTYDAAGNRTSATGPAGTETYQLDKLNRLTSVAYPGGTTAGYTYDPAGNRLTETTPSATTNYTYDAAGQITTAGAATVDHDAAGNLTRNGDDHYTFNSQNQLTSATNGTATVGYTYDADGNRTTATANGATTNLLYDSAAGLPELVRAGNDTYLHADGPIATLQTGQPTSYPLTDALGSVRTTTDFTGGVTATTDYTAFGATRTTTGTPGRFGYTGEPTDTTTGMTYLRARDLNPTLGRFLSSDTVQPNAPGTQGYNHYTYTANNPTTWTDPTGHSTAVIERPVTTTPAVEAPAIVETPALLETPAAAAKARTLRSLAADVLKWAMRMPELCRANARVCGNVAFQIIGIVLSTVLADQITKAVQDLLDSIKGDTKPTDNIHNTEGGKPQRPGEGSSDDPSDPANPHSPDHIWHLKHPCIVNGNLTYEVRGKDLWQCEGVGSSLAKPNFEDGSQPPGPGWVWRGTGAPGTSNRGGWYNPETRESLHPDLSHADPIGPHYDYRAPDGKFYRIFPDGRIEER